MTPPTLTVQHNSLSIDEARRGVTDALQNPTFPRHEAERVTGAIFELIAAMTAPRVEPQTVQPQPLPAPAEVREVTVYANPRAIAGPYMTAVYAYAKRQSSDDIPITFVTGHGPGASVRLKAEVEAEKLRERNRLHEERIEQLTQQLADAEKRVEKLTLRAENLQRERLHAPWCDVRTSRDGYEAECNCRKEDIASLRQQVETLTARLAAVEKERDEAQSLERFGHGQPCYYCGGKCNSLAANPSLWPVGLCHADEPGVVKRHHVGCVSHRLERLAALEAVVKEVAGEMQGYVWNPPAGANTVSFWASRLQAATQQPAIGPDEAKADYNRPLSPMMIYEVVSGGTKEYHPSGGEDWSVLVAARNATEAARIAYSETSIGEPWTVYEWGHDARHECDQRPCVLRGPFECNPAVNRGWRQHKDAREDLVGSAAAPRMVPWKDEVQHAIFHLCRTIEEAGPDEVSTDDIPRLDAAVIQLREKLQSSGVDTKSPPATAELERRVVEAARKYVAAMRSGSAECGPLQDELFRAIDALDAGEGRGKP